MKKKSLERRILSYTVIFERDEDGYSVSVPALQGCLTQGDTFEEAQDNAKDVIALYLEVLKDEKTQNHRCPDAQRRPEERTAFRHSQTGKSHADGIH